jgi:hypothetical protein
LGPRCRRVPGEAGDPAADGAQPPPAPSADGAPGAEAAPADPAAGGGDITISGSTHRTAAVLNLANSGDMGALNPTDVVGRNGETVADLQRAYQDGRLYVSNSQTFFDPSKANDLADSMRQHGYVQDYDAARQARMNPVDHAYKDEFHPLSTSGGSSNANPIDSLPGFSDFVMPP